VILEQATTPLRWPCAPLGGEIECAPAVLQAACAEAALGLRKLAKGGLEGGGVLFGKRAGSVIQILAARPVECEHRFGPSFVLSAKDQALLDQMLADSKADSELASLEPLGFCLSHSRHGAALTENDVELCKRYSGNNCQLALILIPSPLVVRATLLARDAQGAYVSCHEFEYPVLGGPSQNEPVSTRRSHRTGPPVSRAATAAKLHYEIMPALPPPLPLVGPALAPAQIAAEANPAEPAKLASVSRWLAAYYESFQLNTNWRGRINVLVGSNLLGRSNLLAAAVILLVCWPIHSLPLSEMSLSITERDRNLIIHWDPSRPAVRKAALGMVAISDGDAKPVRVSMGPDLLRKGWIPYIRKSGVVRISFTLAGRGITATENALYVAAAGRKIATPVKAKSPLRMAPVVVPVQQAVLTKEVPENNILSAPVRTEQPRAFSAPLERAVRVAHPADNGPAVLPDPPALVQEGVSISAPLQSALNVSFSAPRLEGPPPTLGRLIWTGQLAKRSVLSLSSRGASLGYLDGWSPPKVPVHLEVHPGELIEGGIVIFTKDRNARTEPPSARNGWNTVIYKLDLARASELEVLETPSPANDWSYLVLRNGDRPLSLIVLDWRSTK
jgi:hypothetical protein